MPIAESANERLSVEDEGATCEEIDTCARAGAIQEDALICTAIFFRDTDWAKCEFLPRYVFRGKATRIFVALLTGWVRGECFHCGAYEIPI